MIVDIPGLAVGRIFFNGHRWELGQGLPPRFVCILFSLRALLFEFGPELLTSSVELLQVVLTLESMPSAGLVYVFDIFHVYLRYPSVPRDLGAPAAAEPKATQRRYLARAVPAQKPRAVEVIYGPACSITSPDKDPPH